MSSAVPFVAVTALVVLALVARERKYLLTSTSLVVMAGALVVWHAAIVWMFG
jgi:hypothetical protein